MLEDRKVQRKRAFAQRTGRATFLRGGLFVVRRRVAGCRVRHVLVGAQLSLAMDDGEDRTGQHRASRLKNEVNVGLKER